MDVQEFIVTDTGFLQPNEVEVLSRNDESSNNIKIFQLIECFKHWWKWKWNFKLWEGTCRNRENNTLVKSSESVEVDDDLVGTNRATNNNFLDHTMDDLPHVLTELFVDNILDEASDNNNSTEVKGNGKLRRKEEMEMRK